MANDPSVECPPEDLLVLSYTDRMLEVMARVNEQLARHGLQFVNRGRDGYAAYQLTQIPASAAAQACDGSIPTTEQGTLGHYLTRPERVTAAQYTMDNRAGIIRWLRLSPYLAQGKHPNSIGLETKHGWVYVMPGTWIIRDALGELEALDHNTFLSQYSRDPRRPQVLPWEQ